MKLHHANISILLATHSECHNLFFVICLVINGCRIKLSFPWKLLYVLIDFFSVFLAYKAAESVNIRFLGSTFLPWLVIFVFISWIIGQLNRLILRYGKWVDAE